MGSGTDVTVTLIAGRVEVDVKLIVNVALEVRVCN